MTVKEYLLSKDFKIWAKGEHERIYINADGLDKLGIKKILGDAYKGFHRTVSLYYDCKKDSFRYSCSPSREKHLKEFLQMIRENAKAA